MTTERFPKTVAAVSEAEKLEQKRTAAHFLIGDALIEECGPPGERGVNTGVFDKLRECAKELERLGYRRYSVDHLRDIRAVAAKFPDGERSPSVDWCLYLEAGDPQTLRAAERRAKAEGVALTMRFIAGFKKLRARREDCAESSESCRTISDAARDFRKFASDARDLADDALHAIEQFRQNPATVHTLVDAADSVIAAWQSTRAALIEERPLLLN